MEKLQVELGSVVSGLNVSLELPTIIQTSGLPQADALAFVKDCADGKRKIAKAIINKYEGTSGTASEITEYSTFDELSNKISQIPVEVSLGNAMEQNGGVLPFYDVYNEALKAMKEFAGYGFNGCCAFELDKWSYDKDDKVTLSGADAYYTSDGVYLKEACEYLFDDYNNDVTNRFIIYFYKSKNFTIPTNVNNVTNIFIVKGVPNIKINSWDILKGIYSTSPDEFYSNDNISITNCPLLQTILINNLVGIDSVSVNILSNCPKVLYINFTELKYIRNVKTNMFANSNAFQIINLPKLEELTMAASSTYIVFSNSVPFTLNAPKLKSLYATGFGIFYGLKELNLESIEDLPLYTEALFSASSNYNPNLKKVNYKSLKSATCVLLPITCSMEKIELPNISKLTALCRGSDNIKIPTIHLGNGMRDGVAGDIKIFSGGTNTTITTLTVAKGFKAKLNITGCNGLEREVLLGIINNLADLTGETSLNLIMGATLLAKLTDADKAIATQKNWTLS